MSVSLFCESISLLTDLYQITMVYSYWKAKIAEREAVFHLHFRRRPFQGSFAVAAGLQTAIDFLLKMRFEVDDLAYLRSLKDSKGRALFEESFLDFLKAFDFQCDVDALEEGTLVFPHEPILRVKGPIWQAQLLESPLLNLINFQTLIATKAARVSLAAYPESVIEFGMRRAQGMDGALSASRAAFIGGCESSSHVLAGKLFGIPVRGTHAHSWVMAFDDEKQAFQSFAEIMPGNCILLIDTYDSIKGVKKAIEVASDLKQKGFSLYGVRLDSGDLAELSIHIRALLDQAGMYETKIMVSNELDEYLIRDLKQQGAKIDLWGVGTNLVTGKEQSALDGVYKLSAIQNERGEWVPKLKVSEQTAKTTTPGILQIRRFKQNGVYVGDIVYDELSGISEPFVGISHNDPNLPTFFRGMEFQDLLQPVFQKGRLVYSSPSLCNMQKKTLSEMKKLEPAMKRLTNPQPYFSGLEQMLYQKKIKLISLMKDL